MIKNTPARKHNKMSKKFRNGDVPEFFYYICIINDNEIRRVASSVSSFDVHSTSSPGGADFPW